MTSSDRRIEPDSGDRTIESLETMRTAGVQILMKQLIEDIVKSLEH